MDGFKNSTRTQYMKGGSCEGYAKGGSVKGAAKISKVMGEFKAGTLHSGSKKGPEVTSKKQATAIALSEARKAGAKIPVKKGNGGMLESTSARPVKVGPTPEEKAAGAAVARGNRMQALEAREEAKLMREKRPSHQTEGERRRLMTEGELARRSKAVPVASREPKVRNPLMDRLTQLPSQRGEFPVRKAGGGLAAMPKGKKC